MCVCVAVPGSQCPSLLTDPGGAWYATSEMGRVCVSVCVCARCRITTAKTTWRTEMQSRQSYGLSHRDADDISRKEVDGSREGWEERERGGGDRGGGMC